MKILKRIGLVLLLLVAAANVAIIVTGNQYIYQALIYQHPGIEDFTIFHNRTVEAGVAEEIPSKNESLHLTDSFRSFLQETKTTAFLVLQNDSVVFEEYWDGYGPDSVSGSFSVSKTIVSILVGIAIDEGKISHTGQKVSYFLPQFSEGMAGELTIEHLLTMTAGFDWNEAYSDLFSPTTKAYYGNDLRKMVDRLSVVYPPGTRHEYQSINQVVLAMILEKATGMNLSEYASQKLWKRIGASHNALWSLDTEDGLEKAYCCFNSTARDFSRIGTLYLHKGRWNDQQIVPADYVEASVQPCLVTDVQGNKCDYYGFSWWLSQCEGHSFYYARGILGQYVIVVPDLQLVLVRLGRIKPDHGNMQAADYLVSNVIKIIRAHEEN